MEKLSCYVVVPKSHVPVPILDKKKQKQAINNKIFLLPVNFLMKWLVCKGESVPALQRSVFIICQRESVVQKICYQWILLDVSVDS